MRPRDVLAANLISLMEFRTDLSRFPDITHASDGKLTNGTLDRIRRAEVALTIDRLADLADVFGVEPWQLLVEGLNPAALPQLADEKFLKQIKAIVTGITPSASQDKPETPAHQVKPSDGIDPAVKRVLVTGGKKNAAGSNVRIQKPRTRRGS